MDPLSSYPPGAREERPSPFSRPGRAGDPGNEVATTATRASMIEKFSILEYDLRPIKRMQHEHTYTNQRTKNIDKTKERQYWLIHIYFSTLFD